MTFQRLVPCHPHTAIPKQIAIAFNNIKFLIAKQLPHSLSGAVSAAVVGEIGHDVYFFIMTAIVFFQSDEKRFETRQRLLFPVMTSN